MATPIPECDLLFVVMGSPHSSDLVTTLLRLLQATLERGAKVHVWTCGYATMLTQQGLGPIKQRNVYDLAAEYPTTAALIRELLTGFPGQLSWYTCMFCGEERGAAAHIPEVVVRAPSKFPKHIAAAGKTIFMGVQ